MRGYKNRNRDQHSKRPNIISWWFNRDSVSADLREHQLLASKHFRSNDWRSWSNEFDITITWYGYKLAITIASLTAFFTGIGQILFRLIG